jgi:hypothetical protein
MSEDKTGNNIKNAIHTLDQLSKQAPKEGYLKSIRKRYFRPKTNWVMLGVLVALAAITVSVIINISL